MRVRNHQPQRANLQKYKQVLKSQRSYMNPTHKQLRLEKLINFTTKDAIKTVISDQSIALEVAAKTQEKNRQSRLLSKKISMLEVNSQQKYNNKIQQLKLKINLARSRLKRHQSMKEKPERYTTEVKDFREQVKMHSSDHKPRTKSQQGYKISESIKEQQRRRTNPARNISVNSAPTQTIIYKNEKLRILTKVIQKQIHKIGQQQDELVKFGEDMEVLYKQFNNPPDTILITRQFSQNLRTILGKLIFFIGYEIFFRYSQDIENEFQVQQIVLGSYYQLYFSMRLSIPLLILQCYQVLMDFALERGNYLHAQKYAQKCLQASIFYKQKYYEQKSIQKISMCEYYRGNICQATYLHDNNGQVTQDSIRKIRDGYNEAEQMSIIFHHLYELPRFDVRQLLLEEDENQLKGYKAMVVFQSPRIGVDDSMKSKKNQLKIDIIKMERIKQFKIEAGIMKKQFKRHQNLFTVRKTQKQQNNFKLIKRNLSIDQQNQSSQVLRAHQSLNRISTINKKPIRNKLIAEFAEFCKAIINKINITAIRINLLNMSD